MTIRRPHRTASINRSAASLTPGSSDALAELMRDALSDRKRLSGMGEHAYRVVADEINIETMAESFVHAMRCAAGQA